MSVSICNSRAVETRGPFLVRAATFAMGTRFEFVLVGEDERHLRAVGEEAIAEIHYLHEKFSYFIASSIITRINERAATAPVDLDQETFELLSLCQRVWRESLGAFDITIPPLIRTWGFRSTLAISRDAATPETVCGTQHIILDKAHQAIAFTKPGIEIDLGAVAKGYALDRAAAIAREGGVTTALLHGGTSTVITIGAPPHTSGWRIRIHDERKPRDVTLRDQALSVSAQRGRTITNGDQSHGHIIDPRTGAPVSAGTTTAAVIAPEAALADVWSTALLVLGERPSAMPDSLASMIRDDVSGWRCDGNFDSRAPLRVAAKHH